MDVSRGDILRLIDGRSVVVTDIPEGNEDAPENLLIVSTEHDEDENNLFVIHPFQIDSVVKP